MKINLASKFSLFAAALTFFTASAVGYLIHKGANQLLVEQTILNISQELEQQSRQIISDIQTLKEDVSFIANTHPVQKLIRASSATESSDKQSDYNIASQELASLFTSFIREKSHYTQIRFIGVKDQGRELVRTERFGNNILSIPRNGLQQKGKSLYFLETVKYHEGDVYISKIELNKEHGKIVEPYIPVIRSATPIFDERNQKIFGIIIINMDLREFLLQLQKSAPGNSRLYVTNSEGDYLIHPDTSKIFSFEFGKEHKIQDLYPELANEFQKTRINWLQRNNSFSIKKSNNIFKFLEVPFNSLDKSRFLGLGLEMSYDAAIEKALTLRNRSIFLSLGLILFAIIISLLFSRFIAAPIKSITKAANEFANGRLDETISLPIEAKDEVGVLARTFQNMQHKIIESSKDLKLSEERSRGIIEGSLDCIITFNEDGTIQSFNQAGEAMFGYSATELIDQNIKKLIIFDYKAVQTNSSYNVSNQFRKTLELEAKHKTGTTFPVRLALSNIALGNNQLFIGIINDITEEVNAREEIKCKNKEAEAARAIAEKANNTKSAFLANITHELRTPLNSLLLLSEDLLENEDKNLTNDQLENIGIIHNGGKGLLNLINDLLDLSKVEAGKMNIFLEEFPIRTITTNARNNFSHIAKQKNLELKITVEKDIPEFIISDITRLEQILRNFLSNAFKFTAQGYIELHIFIPHTDKDTISFSVKDTGIGIPSNKLDDIFLDFQQANSSTTREYGGTGLGLSISKKLALLLEGKILVNSEEGKGSTFTLSIPMKVGPSNQLSLSSDPISNQQNLNSDKKSNGKMSEGVTHQKIKQNQNTNSKNKPFIGKNILLVDDDNRNIISLSRILKKTGATIHTAQNGKEAINSLNENSDIDVVLMDMMMPIMNGYEAINKLRQERQFANMPIIAATANALSEDKEKCIESGANCYISKPINKEELLETITRLIG